MPDLQSPPARKRLFLALPIPTPIRITLSHIQNPLQTIDLPVKWQPGKLMHLTLAFLGEMDETHVEPLTAILHQIGQATPRFHLELEALGAFPSYGHPRILWMGVQPSRELVRVQKALTAALATAGYVSEPQDYYPHITLGRCAHDLTRESKQRLQAALSKPAAMQGESRWEVDRIHLYESRTDEFGLHYTPLSGVMLNA